MNIEEITALNFVVYCKFLYTMHIQFYVVLQNTIMEYLPISKIHFKERKVAIIFFKIALDF